MPGILTALGREVFEEAQLSNTPLLPSRGDYIMPIQVGEKT